MLIEELELLDVLDTELALLGLELVLMQELELELGSELVDEQEELELTDRLLGLELLDELELLEMLEEELIEELLEELDDDEDSSVSCRPSNQTLYVMSAPFAVRVI